jgi:hypothetical protein
MRGSKARRGGAEQSVQQYWCGTDLRYCGIVRLPQVPQRAHVRHAPVLQIPAWGRAASHGGHAAAAAAVGRGVLPPERDKTPSTSPWLLRKQAVLGRVARVRLSWVAWWTAECSSAERAGQGLGAPDEKEWSAWGQDPGQLAQCLCKHSRCALHDRILVCYVSHEVVQACGLGIERAPHAPCLA